jgi:hypothetical protein
MIMSTVMTVMIIGMIMMINMIAIMCMNIGVSKIFFWIGFYPRWIAWKSNIRSCYLLYLFGKDMRDLSVQLPIMKVPILLVLIPEVDLIVIESQFIYLFRDFEGLYYI